MPNWSQISGVIERVITAAVMFAVGKGYITSGDATNVIALIVGILSAFYAFFVNRNINLAKQAASIPNTIVVTESHVATKTTQSNIVSNASFKVVS